MRPYFVTGAPVIFTIVVLLKMVSGFPTTFRLERSFPVDNFVDLNALKLRDSLRHPRILQRPQSSSVVDFPVLGKFDDGFGLYFTRVLLGSPPKEYYVQIDTGSDLMWISCDKCNGCPRYSDLLHIPMHHYDPSSSSTASVISCSDQRCALGIESLKPVCSSPNNRCSYTFQYGDGSRTSGFCVSDKIQLNTVVGDSRLSNASASIVFGCSTTQTGYLTNHGLALNGIIGLGQQDLSVIVQLSSQGVAPGVFSHCLVGNGTGGGILVLGQIIEPNMVYTPLIPSLPNYLPHYTVTLLSISVNGQKLPIDPSLFTKSGNRWETIIDSGTILAYLPKEAFDPFVDAITRSISQSVRPVILSEHQCYVATSRTHDMFPNVSLNFAGGASMFLRPQDYLVSKGETLMWCIGFQVTPDLGMTNLGMTILGDLVLKDKVVVYDLGGQRIGWANYDCTSSVNVSTTSTGGRREHMNAGQIGSSSSLVIIVAFGLVIASISY